MYLFLFSLQVQELSKDDSNGKEGLIVFLFILKKKLRNSDFLITISSQHNVVYLSNYEFCQIKHVLSLKYQRFTPSGCKYIARLENQCLWQKLSYFHGLETKLITLLKL